jgi:glycosyltransferase involved in cell wall biosynthesis
VSVIVPCRDAAAWLPETLASVLDHAAPVLEVIVVDDGSIDGSAEVAAAFGGRVRLLRQTAQGASAARNAGTVAARGDYLQYLDADDVLEPGTLEQRVAALTQTGADVSLSPWARWTRQSDGRFQLGPVESRRLGDRPDVELLTEAWWPPGAVLYRREIVRRIGGWRTDLPVIQDARFLLDAALAGARFAYTDRPGLRYRVHGPASLSRRDPMAFAADCLHSAADLEARWRADGTLDEPRRQALLRAYGYVARSTFAEDRTTFDEVMSHILALDPHFRPEQPRALRRLSGVIGYRAAEHVAWWWRQLKRNVRLATTTRPTEPRQS